MNNILNCIKQKLYYNTYKVFSNIIDFGSQVEKREYFHKNAVLHSSTKVFSSANINNLSGNPDLISIGENSVIRGQLLIFAHAGKIEIGKDCYIGEGTRIWSADSIKIGNRVLISHNVNIHDTNSHSLEPGLRHQHFMKIVSTSHPIFNDLDIKSKAILIEDDVWMGFNSTILKGVKIGKGAVVAACSVVTKDVSEFVVVAGNPATVITKL